ncbi:LacI family DNA-binding transcriptional regulator [Microbacterium sulfonylureivorans]|uniref:LacI family DNA-binding transcriptional regulator n=1 Tax=Microbacterium sulfonylureivorans TaxID=2486854 RepID=UPI000FDB3053|nr:LacI family DNA-binding transcriptional regulator [Microbacterium sulfonylureivorans]
MPKDAPDARPSAIARDARYIPTLNDVARVAGVSKGTVSKVLNGRAGLRAETREKVESAARQLGYRPNLQAVSLMEGRTRTVGLLTHDLEGRFCLPILVGAEDALGAGKLSVLLCDSRGDAIRERYHLEALLARRVDGLIAVGDKAAARPSLGILPVPVVYALGPSLEPNDTSVVTDDVQAGRIGAEHLVNIGRTRIAYIGGDASYRGAHERVEGVEGFLREKGMALITPPIFGAWSETWGFEAARQIVTRSPDVDAIMCGNDQIARGAIDSLREHGRRVPTDVAVLGHDNWETLALAARPPLSSVDANYQGVGRKAAELLFRLMAGDSVPGVHPVLSRVVPRGSTI